MLKPKVVVIVGPTSSGKSDLAVRIAKRFNGEVVSADSRQVYRGLNIGSGKVPRDKKIPKLYFYKGIHHHLLDVVSPKTTFTVVRYKHLARKAIENILRRGKIPIICGGTGLYIDALLYDWDIPKVEAKPVLRKELSHKSKEELFKMLSGLDPARAATIDKNNKVRLIRALEIILTTGSPVPEFKPFKKKGSPYNFFKIGIKISNDELKDKIHARLVKRLKQGMVGEVKKLHRRGVSWKRLDSFGLEYRYISRYLQGLISYKELIEIIEKENRRYAKRQMTWFKRDKNIIWIDVPQKAFSIVRGFLDREVRP